MSGSKRVLISGGGIAGLSLLTALRQRGLAAELVERELKWAPVGGGIAVQPNAIRVLHQLGLGKQVEESGNLMRRHLFRDQQGGVLCEIDLEQLWGNIGAYVTIERTKLHDILLTGAAQTSCRLGTWITSLAQNGDHRVRVELSNGRVDDYDLVVGADGIHSSVRQFALKSTVPDYGGQMVWRSVVRMPSSEPDAVQFWLGDGCFFGFCPVGKDRTYGFANVTGPQFYDDVRGRLDRLRRRFDGFGGSVRDYLACLQNDEQLHCAPIEWLELDTWHSDRIVLIGDAAHASSPMMGQGGCMAIEDAIVLAEALHSMADVEHALDAYVKRRRPRVNWVQQQSRAVGDTLGKPVQVRNMALRQRGRDEFYSRYQPLVMHA